MTSIKAVLTALVVLVLLAVTPAAGAQTLSVADEAGDRLSRGLDLVGVRVANRDRAIVTRVEVTRAVRGDLIVSIDPRHARGVRVVNRHRPQGTDRSFVVAGSFTDRRPGGTTACQRLRVSWEATVVTLRLPSRCLNRGNYGAVRVSVLTEGREGDVDWAPERLNGEIGATDWIPRG